MSVRRAFVFRDARQHVTVLNYLIARYTEGRRPKEQSMESSYRVAGIDMHKSMLAVVISDVAGEGEFQFERRKFGAVPSELRALAVWLKEQDVREAVMESTAQYWKPVWHELEGQCQLSLAQAQSNRAPRGRKRDFADAERLLRRHVAGELILSFVPNPEQRLWRMMTRVNARPRADPQSNRIAAGRCPN
jgi:hypothetical protein